MKNKRQNSDLSNGKNIVLNYHAPHADSRSTSPIDQPTPTRRGYGGLATSTPPRVGHSKGGGTQTRRSFAVGDKVRRVGAGVWGIGTIVGIIPMNVNPRWYCRRHGLPIVFGARSESAMYARYIVACDDGRYHTPRNVEAV